MNFCGKSISGPFTIPSGIITTEPSVLARIAADVPQIGILTTKSISVHPKAGNREPVFGRYTPEEGSFVNAVGLSNPGAEVFAQKLVRSPIPKDKFLMISVFGASAEEFVDAAGILSRFADGFELNISCPHARGYGQAICEDAALVGSIIRGMKKLGKPVFVKISPNVDIRATVETCLDNGVDGFVAINTWGPKREEHDGHAVLTNTVGGVSGSCIRDIGIRAVALIRSMTDKPIIACGGIATGEDIRKYAAAGAQYFGVGSALTGMDTDEVRRYFHALESDWKGHTATAPDYLQSSKQMKYHKTSIAAIKRIDDSHSIIIFRAPMRIKPGQFVFLWIPGVGEKPFSLLGINPGSVFVKAKGCFTEALLNLPAGARIYWRGPYGKTVPVRGRTLLIGAGTGIAALAMFARRGTRTYAVLGARQEALCLRDEAFGKRSGDYWITTSREEGRPEQHVGDVLPEAFRAVRPDTVLICGPEQMVYDTVETAKQFVPERSIYASVEFMTKCGVGICGSCATAKGLRNCVDGTFLGPGQLI